VDLEVQWPFGKCVVSLYWAEENTSYEYGVYVLWQTLLERVWYSGHESRLPGHNSRYNFRKLIGTQILCHI